MLRIKDIILRDFKESDIDKRIYWETVETEWQQWDGPWEYEGMTEGQKQEELQAYIESMKEWAVAVVPSEKKRKTFQIDVCDPEPIYIGWVNSYYLDEKYSFTRVVTDQCAIGIDIPDVSVRGKGYAYQALGLFIDYLFKSGEKEIYTQTWSGNKRMIHIAEKMGFEECCRKVDLRTVQGKKYDGLTFRLNKDRYAEFVASQNKCRDCR